MTNGDRIRGMGNNELAEELKKFGVCDFREYVDLAAWLNSEEAEYTIPGDRALVHMDNGKIYHGTIVDERNMSGQKYYKLIMDADFPYSSRILSTPKKSVDIEK